MKKQVDFENGVYRVKGEPGIAWYAWRYKTELVYDSEWYCVDPRHDDVHYLPCRCCHACSEEFFLERECEPTEVEDRDIVIMTMVGDDRKHEIDVDDISPLNEGEYCPECGQKRTD